MSKQAKMIARWLHENLTWKKILMTWMVVLVASKMVLLMLTFEYFSLTALISLQIFHGVWTIAFFCLDVLRSQNNVILDNVLFDEPSGLVEDMEPIDFEHFVDQDDDVDADDAGRSAGERMFRVTFGESPPGRGR